MDASGAGSYQTKTYMLPDGDPGTARTMDLIRRLVAQGIKDPRVRRAAVEILHSAGAAAHNETAEVQAIFQWVLSNIRFTKDMVDREMLQPAADILITRAGDCDDINAILLPSLLGAIGYATRAVTIKANPEDPESFSHVFLKVYLPASGEWLSLDAAQPGASWGAAPEQYWAAAEWPLTDSARSLGSLFPRPGARRSRTPLGQFNWSSLLQSVPSIESGAAQIVSAANQPQFPYGIYPTTQTGAVAPGTFGVTATGGISTSVLLVAGLGIVALLMLSRR